jgi:hypothetical protein
MFKIAQSETYVQSVTVQIPGSKVKNTFDVEFKRLPQSEINVTLERIKNAEITDVDFCNEIVVGWKGVADESGELAFSADNLAALLEVFPVSRTIVQTYFDGMAGAKAKN